MKAVSEPLYQLLLELQSIPLLNDFYLAGGTNLALRFNHRKSQDIDLFSDKCVGHEGLKNIRKSLIAHFKSKLLFCNIINAEFGEQYCFLRTLINKDDENIKVEILQNFARMYPVEIINGIRMMTIKDVGLLKLMSAGNRAVKKDIYDLDIITDNISLVDLLNSLRKKKTLYNREKDKSLFDLDDEINPAEQIDILLHFDKENNKSKYLRPSHSNDMIDIMPNSKSWRMARSSWIRKVKNI